LKISQFAGFEIDVYEATPRSKRGILRHIQQVSRGSP
jgi:hypothetical protein